MCHFACFLVRNNDSWPWTGDNKLLIPSYVGPPSKFCIDTHQAIFNAFALTITTIAVYAPGANKHTPPFSYESRKQSFCTMGR